MTPLPRPAGGASARPLHLFWIVDCSGSMAADGKIEELNFAIREAIPELRRVAGENPHADLLVRAVRFGTGAAWHIGTPTPIDELRWTDLQAGGVTDLGAALSLVMGELDRLGGRGLPPVLVLVSDGRPTDDYAGAIRALAAGRWGEQSVRIAIAIGDDADDEVLRQFLGRPDARVLRAEQPEALARQVRWVSTRLVPAAMSGSAPTPEGGPEPLPVPALADPATPGAPDVW
jgi:uncharacterized protein YegL